MMDSEVAVVNGKTYRMQSHFILIMDDEIKEKSDGGVFYPTEYVSGIEANMMRKGRVMAIGPGKMMKSGQRVPVVGVKPGDLVMYPRTVGQRIDELEGTDRWVRIVDQMQLFMVVDEED